MPAKTVQTPQPPSSDLPITEKYRPRTLSEVVGQEVTVKRLTGFVESYKAGKPNMPNLLFVGPPGLGKTTCAKALCHDLYGELWRTYTLETNASDERGIDVIRGRVKDFAKTSALGEHFNVIILDECDNLTNDAQAALRRVMEDYAKSCRFVLCCNYPNKVIQPLIDRCAVFRFKPVPDDAMFRRLEQINKLEGLERTADEGREVVAAAKGSMRKALYLLGGIDELSASDAGKAVEYCYANNMKEAESEMIRVLKMNPSPSEVFLSIFNKLDAMKRPNKELFIVGEYEFRVIMGGGLELQARCLLRHLAGLALAVPK